MGEQELVEVSLLRHGEPWAELRKATKAKCEHFESVAFGRKEVEPIRKLRVECPNERANLGHLVNLSWVRIVAVKGNVHLPLEATDGFAVVEDRMQSVDGWAMSLIITSSWETTMPSQSVPVDANTGFMGVRERRLTSDSADMEE